MSSDDTASVMRPSGRYRTLGLADTGSADIADVSPPTGPARLQPGAVLEHYELIRKQGRRIAANEARCKLLIADARSERAAHMDCTTHATVGRTRNLLLPAPVRACRG